MRREKGSKDRWGREGGEEEEQRRTEEEREGEEGREWRVQKKNDSIVLVGEGGVEEGEGGAKKERRRPEGKKTAKYIDIGCGWGGVGGRDRRAPGWGGEREKGTSPTEEEKEGSREEEL